MVCELNIKEYEAIIQLMVDLDRQQIVYPITTDNAVILTTLKESPITLAEYLSKIKEYSQEGILSLYEKLLGENPEGKAYRATDGLLLEDRVSIVNNGLDVLKNKLLSLEDSLEGEDSIQSDLNTLKDRIHNLELIILNLEYEYEVILFKATDDLNLDPNGNIITPEEPYTNSDGEFSGGWDINYSNLSINKYIWMATTIVKIKNNTKIYLPWKITLLYDNKGNYVGDLEKYEKKIYYRTLNYIVNLPAPGNNLDGSDWRKSPLGVSPLWPYEYVSCRWYTVDETPLGEWSTPVLWSRWGANGRDSADIEYIYCAISEELSPEADWPYNDGSNPEEWTNDDGFLLTEYIRESQSSLWFDNPVGLTIQRPYLYVSIRKRSYSSSTDSYIWDSYSKPALWSSLGKDGNIQEVQGLMGPVIRFKGDFDPDKEYVNMKNDTTLGVDDIRYVDVVRAEGSYYMVKPIEGGTRRTSNSPVNNLSEWQKAEDFSFIATEVLYAEDAKIDYLASNEVVIFNKDPNDTSGSDAEIVAGMTGGNSTLIDDISTYGEGNNPVRIWAGSSSTYTEDETTKINLLEAPFRVYQDGKFVATNAEITGDISADSISLRGDKMFWYNKSTITLPEFGYNLHMLAYIMLYNNGLDCLLNTYSLNLKILYFEVNNSTGLKSIKKSTRLTIKDNSLYTLISNYDEISQEYQWIITLLGVYNTVVTSTNYITAPLLILKEGFYSPGDINESAVQLYVNEVRFNSENNYNRYISINFKLKLGDDISCNKAFLQLAIITLKLPGKDNNNIPIVYVRKNITSPYIANFPEGYLDDLENFVIELLMFNNDLKLEKDGFVNCDLHLNILSSSYDSTIPNLSLEGITLENVYVTPYENNVNLIAN